MRSGTVELRILIQGAAGGSVVLLISLVLSREWGNGSL